jgi:hypothetical protein
MYETKRVIGWYVDTHSELPLKALPKDTEFSLERIISCPIDYGLTGIAFRFNIFPSQGANKRVLLI